MCSIKSVSVCCQCIAVQKACSLGIQRRQVCKVCRLIGLSRACTGKGKEAAAAAATAEVEMATPPEPVAVPSETVYMQIIDFLLDSKATPVRRSVLESLLVAAALFSIFLLRNPVSKEASKQAKTRRL